MLTFELIESNSENKIYRAAIIGGWLVRIDNSIPDNYFKRDDQNYFVDGYSNSSQLTFVPDFKHEWDGSSFVTEDEAQKEYEEICKELYGKSDSISVTEDYIKNKELEMLMANAKPITEINVGDRFLCIKNVVMSKTNKITYFIGKEYLSERSDHITNDREDSNHYWTPEVANKYFIKL